VQGLFSRIFSFTWSSRSAAATSIIIVDIRPPFTEHPTPSSHHSITHSIFATNFINMPMNFSQANIFGIQTFIH
jgi:hypothetical protein